jgi:hypothetical protein
MEVTYILIVFKNYIDKPTDVFTALSEQLIIFCVDTWGFVHTHAFTQSIC